MSENEDLALGEIAGALRGILRRGTRAQPWVLITGGTGTLGSALTRSLLIEGYHVTVLSRDAHKQALFKAQFPNVTTVLADICDADAVRDACIGQDVLIHAAALKRVDSGEEQVNEFARVNIEGTRVVARCAHDMLVERCLFISSDKAVSPLNFYGVTKAVGERLWLAQQRTGRGAYCRFSVVRYGNVMGSNGSVLQLWRERLRKGLPIVVREPSTTRFLMTLDDALETVRYALEHMQGGEIFVPTFTPAFSLHELARGVQEESKWQRAPLGNREKLHERLLAPGECYEQSGPRFVRVWPQKSGEFVLPDWACSEKTRRLSVTETMQLLGES